MSNSVNKKLVILIPIITTILFFSSVSGIIGNAILLDNQNTSIERSFVFRDLTPNEIESRAISVPDNIDDLEIVLQLTYFGTQNQSIERVNVYFSENSLPVGLNTISDLESSTYFDDEIIDSGTTRYTQSFYPSGSINDLYLIIGNINDQTLDLNVYMTISDTDFTSDTNPARVLGVIFSAIFTALFFFGSIYLWLEFFTKIDARILTQDLEETIQDYAEKALSWEIVIFALAIIFAISGYTEVLIGQGAGRFVFAIIGFGFVYYNYTSRQRIEANIINVLRSQSEISLTELSNQILEDKETTKKALLDAIMYSELPAHLDLKTEMVYYNPDKDFSTEYAQEDIVQQNQFQVASSEVRSEPVDDDDSASERPLPRCAYCDTEAISVNAQFCHSCGASMSSAK